MALETLLTEALDRLPVGIVTAPAKSDGDADPGDETAIRAGTAADGATIKEGSYLSIVSGVLTPFFNDPPEGG
jgi:hypothetical protein